MNPHNSQASPYWRRPAILMVLLAAGLMFVNAARAFADPIGFAIYLGLPIAEPSASGFVLVYGVRALFIGALAAALLVTRQVRALTWFAATATIMPVGDAILTAQAGAPGGTIGRHIAIAVFLLLTAWLLSRLHHRAT
jgi:Domain of unknown function (DUF4267)